MYLYRLKKNIACNNFFPAVFTFDSFFVDTDRGSSPRNQVVVCYFKTDELSGWPEVVATPLFTQ